jgi:hypothetical protein
VCQQLQAAFAKLEARVAALESELTGPPPEDILEASQQAMAECDARQAAIRDYHRLRREEFYQQAPWAREADEQERIRFDAFMTARGFKPKPE